MHSYFLGVAAGMTLTVSAAAGPERVDLPANYAAEFVNYDRIDKPDRQIVRFMYVDPATHDAAMPGEPLPDGAVIIMEDHAVALEGEEPRLDGGGRLMPTDEIVGIAVMEKQPGWGEDVSQELRNGDWDYAAYTADGALRPDVPYDRCFECHKPLAETDYTFSFYPYLERR